MDILIHSYKKLLIRPIINPNYKYVELTYYRQNTLIQIKKIGQQTNIHYNKLYMNVYIYHNIANITKLIKKIKHVNSLITWHRRSILGPTH